MTGTSQAVQSDGGLSHDVPRHVAIIMDGNGRWATARGLPRFEGHRRGVEALRRAVRIAGDVGIDVLTVYAFSSENWKRPQSEIAELMGLLKLFVRRDLAELHRNNVRVRSIGERQTLAPDLRGLIEEAEHLTRANTKMTLVIAFNYGARDELTRAMRQLARSALSGGLDPESITDQTISSVLDAPDLPDPDLIIRTSGEQRLSNFLLWQAAYAEFVFLPVLWPDFDRAHFDEALAAYRNRERRFGGVDREEKLAAVGGAGG
ncbi:MAG: isoprenyl transferase [Rhizobiaceae bacterium]|jgi:undecaprenyl diphosphate synthase|nr:isoprenyl transferase [Rhizobiaceae bacterium]